MAVKLQQSQRPAKLGLDNVVEKGCSGGCVMLKKVVPLTALLLLSSFALATSVTYTTTGTVTGSAPATFTGTTQTDPFTPFVSSLGTFAFTCSGHCSGTDHFTITIAQSAPGSGSGTLTATLSGIIAFKTNGTGKLVFGAATVITAGGEATTYTGLDFTLTSNAVPLLAQISQVHVPEPAAELLLRLGAFGLFGLTVMSRRRIVSV
jgi:hypothetical protein